MSELFDSEFLRKLQMLAITAKTVQTTVYAGNRKSGSKGSSVEFSDYREYVFGDDFRHIDWNAFGRFERFFVKLFMEEREASVHIFLDTSSSMDYGTPNKKTVSRRLGAALAYISLARNDMVSLSLVGDTHKQSKLSLRGKNSFSEVMNFLEGAEYGGPTNLLKAVESSPLKQERGISLLVSDFLPPDGLLDTIKLLQFRKQEVYICHTLSPQEIDPKMTGNLCLIDSETKEKRDASYSENLMKAYHKAFTDYIGQIEEMCLKRAVNYLLMNTDTALDEMLRRVADIL